MDKRSLLTEYLACPDCLAGLTIGETYCTCPDCGNRYPVYDGEIVSALTGEMAQDVDFSREKWTAYYKNERTRREAETVYRESTLPIVLRQLFDYTDERPKTPRVFLEIGCGQAFLGEEMARRGWLFIGIDYSLPVLRLLKARLDSLSIDNYLLIHGDITRLPIRSGTIDFIYGGGVIEHFRDTQPVVDHLYRILCDQGVSFNSVPFVNIGNVLYRSRWGSIPNIPLVRQIAEFVNIRLLGGRHMRFGYELQRTTGQLKNIHRRAGFRAEDITIGRFDYTVTLENVKNKKLRNVLTNLIKTNRHFWQMVKVVAIKRSVTQSGTASAVHKP